jgi:hypothetical protein
MNKTAQGNKPTIAKAILDKAFKTTQEVETITTAGIRDVLITAKTNNGFISIVGYKSANGNVANFLVQPLGEHGYLNKIKECLEFIKTLEIPDQFEYNTWCQAVIEKIASWEKSLAGEHKRINKFNKVNKGVYTHDDSKAVYIKNVVTVLHQPIVVSEKKHVNSSQLTLAKNYINDLSPLGAYKSCFKLVQGNFEKVAFNKIVIEG